MLQLISAVINTGALFLTLAYNPPVYIVDLNSTRPGADIAALEHAGIVKRVGIVKGFCGQNNINLFVTESGQKIAASRGWNTSDGVLAIPVGRFDIVSSQPGSGGDIHVVVRFIGNRNAEYLMRLAEPKAWAVQSLPSLRLSLSDVGHSRPATVPAYNDASQGVTPIPGWHDSATPCAK